MACHRPLLLRRLVRGSRWVAHRRYDAVLQAVAVMSYSEGVELGGVVARGQYGVLQFIAIISCMVYGEGSELGGGQVMSSGEVRMLCV